MSESYLSLAVVSEDVSLLGLCHEIAREFVGMVWRITQIEPGDPVSPDVDLCIWDYPQASPIPESVKWSTRHFVLVPSRDVPAFRSAHPFAEAAIVLKPITRAMLRALMHQVIAASSDPGAAGDRSVRTDRDDILQCLIQANLRLQQYDEERTNFLSRAIHDFHAPLTALSGYCGLLLEQDAGTREEEQKVIIRRMYNSTRRLARMTRAMFHLSVGRHVDLKPTLRQGDIRECAEQALYEVSQFVQEKQLQIEADLESTNATLLFERGQVEQVLINLLENACRFTPRFGSIQMKGYAWFWERRTSTFIRTNGSDRRTREERTPNCYRIDITDSGPGITPEHLGSIFEEYVSYSGGRDRSGGGLGLAICRMILSQHHGRIWAENCSSGAVFSFVLPFQRADARESDCRENDQPSATKVSAVCV